MKKEHLFSRIINIITKKAWAFWGSGAILIYFVYYSSFFSLGLSVDQFFYQFNNSMAKIKFEQKIKRIPLEQDIDGSHFGFQINEKIGVKGVVNSDGNIRTIGFLFIIDRPPKSTEPIIDLILNVIEIVDPSLMADERYRLLNELELPSKKASGELVRNNLKYRFSKTEVAGALSFYVMRAYDPLYDPFYNNFIISPARK